MIGHLFKMLWNRRKSNFLLMLELFFSFLVLMVVSNFILTIAGEYLKSSGYNHQIDKVMLYQLSWDNVPDAEAKEGLLRLKRQIESMPNVAEVASTRNSVPYVHERWDWVDAKYQGQIERVRQWDADDQFARVLKLSMLSGNWFSAKDNSSNVLPIVINQDMQKAVYGDKNPVGEIIRIRDQDRRIIGVVENSYSGGLAKPMPGYFERNNLENPHTQPVGHFLIRFKNEIDIDTYTKMDKLLRDAGLGEQWSNPQSGALEIFRSYWFRELVIPIVLVAIVAGFLFINVVVGLYGVFWQNINRRRSEIGLRRAVGASSGLIYRQMLSEVLVLATLAMIPGFIIGIQFLVFDTFDFIDSRMYVLVLFWSALLIYLLVTVCALYPGWIASRIQPAEALHEE